GRKPACACRRGCGNRRSPDRHEHEHEAQQNPVDFAPPDLQLRPPGAAIAVGAARLLTSARDIWLARAHAADLPAKQSTGGFGSPISMATSSRKYSPRFS